MHALIILKSVLLPHGLALLAWLVVAIVSRWTQYKKDQQLHAQLMQELLFYRRLDHRHQRRFRDRVRAVVEDKEFIGRSIEVTPAVQNSLAASLVQLTFGLHLTTLAHFTRIIVYPDRYRSRIGQTDHVGEVNPGLRAIVISWKRFCEDNHITDDGRNLGLHEMAHALWFEDRTGNQDLIRLDKRLMARWRELAKAEAARIHAGNSSLFRDYAGTNQEEFFAVAVEYFFEQPAEFRQALPELYATMAGLLKQDPAKGVSPNGTSTAR
ncbi:MAG: zinc-dependent peptidase [Flavobacteriales bacterium]|nr:zinc-dependent peptidase [Flavobacteriales bacterium]